MNNYPSPTSFADILLDEINQTKRDFASIELKNRAIYSELSKQFEQDMEYLTSECEKLGIEVDYSPFTTSCYNTIQLGWSQARDERFSIGVEMLSKLHIKNGIRQTELVPNLRYRGETFEEVVNSTKFKNQITQLYHKIG